MKVADLGLNLWRLLTQAWFHGGGWFVSAPEEVAGSGPHPTEITGLGLLPQRLLPNSCFGRGSWLRPTLERSLVQA